MQLHLLSFEGPDPYSRAGGLAARVNGLAETLTEAGHDVHLWFVGDPDAPDEESDSGRPGRLTLHRWCQPISARARESVYAAELDKEADFTAHLPARLLTHVLLPALEAGQHAVVMAEEWQTVRAVLRIDRLLRQAHRRDRVSLLWNANDTVGFERIDWKALAQAARITTVSRYMKHRLQEIGVEALAIPNGLPDEAFAPFDPRAVEALRRRFRDRLLLTKMALWDPDQAWLATIETAAELKRRGRRPLLVARGALSAYGEIVLDTARRLGLEVRSRETAPGPDGLVRGLSDLDETDVVHLRSPLEADAHRVLLHASDAVLANRIHEPFGQVGLETMAAAGIACTGCSGEDYAVPGQNALVLQTGEPQEFIALYERLRRSPDDQQAFRRAGRATARRYVWPEIRDRVLLPRIRMEAAAAARTEAGSHPRVVSPFWTP